MKLKMGVYLDGIFIDRHKRECPVTMILDTGNFNESVMSLQCAQSLGLHIKETNHTATGVDGKGIHVIGQVGPLKFKLNEPCKKEFHEKFIIIDKMSVPINLSVTFMMNNYIEVRHSPNGNVVCVGDFEMPLKSNLGNRPNLISQVNSQNLCDYTFQEPTGMSIPGLNENTDIPVAELGPQKVSLRSLETVIIPSKTICNINAFCTVSNLCNETKLGFVSPKPIGKRELLILEGVVPCENSNFQVNIVNYENKPVTVQQNSKIGFIWKATMKDKNTNKEKITAVEKAERINFIREKLNVSNIPILDSDTDQKRLIAVFLDNWECISKSPEDIGKTNLHTFDLKLNAGTTPFRSKPIRINPDAEAQLDIQINKWLQQKVIKEGDSPWSHPIFAVRKKAANTGETALRWVLDFRKLNNVTEKLAAPIPHIGDTLERLGNSKIYSVLDLTAAYHAMKMSTEAGKATAFCTKKKQYVFLRMPFGLSNAPASFCQLMQKVYELNPELEKFSMSYLDDIIVHSNTLEEHFIHLRKVLECLCTAGLKLNIGKCNLFAPEVKFLGHCVSSSGISMDRDYLAKIAAWNRPVTGKDIQRYLGFLNYYSTYFADFAKTTQPLNKLRGEKTIEWTEPLIESFNETKNLFLREVKKAYPDWNGGVFILDTDFSSKAFGVVLSQIQNGEEKLINCTSKVCNVSERNYPSWKGELCALIHAFKKYNYILRYKPFLVRTDSTCLETYKTWSKLDSSGVTVRWILYLQSFDFNIIYRKGKEHINADYLSRDMLENKPVSSEIESIEGDKNLVDQIYNLNYSVKSKKTVAVFDLQQRLRAREWSRHTEEDDILKQVRDSIIKNLPSNSAELQTLPYRAKQYMKYFEYLKVEDGLVILSQPMGDGIKIIDRVCVPIGLYNTVFSFAHGLRSSGHKGVTETINKINKHFFMPYLQKFVEFSVTNCIVCLNRRDKPRHKTKIERSVYSGQPLETIYIDHIGPFTPTKFRGKNCAYILIIVDAYSRFTITYPVPDCSASTVIDQLVEEFIPSHGFFNRIVSDRGTAFTSKVFNEVMEQSGVLKYHIPPRNPNSNPQERYNKQLLSYIKTDLTFETNKWANKLNYATFCANTSFNRRLGNTPFYIFHGRDPKLPIDLFNPLSSKFEEINHKGFQSLIEKIEEGWRKLKNNTNRYLRIQNLHRQDLPLCENTICYAFFHIVKVGLSKKLQSFFLGPLIISKRYTNSLYLLTPLDTCPIKSKKPIVVARDKIYPMETKLELCPREWIALDLKPNELIHPDDCILIDRKLFQNFNSCSVSGAEISEQEDSIDHHEKKANTAEKALTEDSIKIDHSNSDSPSKNGQQVVSESSSSLSSLHLNSNVVLENLSPLSRQKGGSNISISNLPSNELELPSTRSRSSKTESITDSTSASNLNVETIDESGQKEKRSKKGSTVPTRKSSRTSKAPERYSSMKDIVEKIKGKRAESRYSAQTKARSRTGSRKTSLTSTEQNQ